MPGEHSLLLFSFSSLIKRMGDGKVYLLIDATKKNAKLRGYFILLLKLFKVQEDIFSKLTLMTIAKAEIIFLKCFSCKFD